MPVDSIFRRPRREQHAIGLDLEHVARVQEIAGIDDLASHHQPLVRYQRSDSQTQTHLLPIDLDITMDNKLSRLPRTARKECSKDGRIEPSLDRRVEHLHVGRLIDRIRGSPELQA